MNEVITAIVAGVASIFVATIGGIYAVKAARAGAENAEGIKKGGSNTFPRIFLIGILALPISFLFAYAGNSLSVLGAETEHGLYVTNAFGDSLDSALVGALMCVIGFIIGVALTRLDTKE